MSKLNKIFLVIIVILLIVLGAILFWQKGSFDKAYYAVYLNTGDLYFGELHSFPHLSFSNVWMLQENSNDITNPYNLIKFKDVFWGPEDNLRFSKENIVWITKLSKDSQVVQYIEGTLIASTTQKLP